MSMAYVRMMSVSDGRLSLSVGKMGADGFSRSIISSSASDMARMSCGL